MFYGPNMQAPTANAPLTIEEEQKVYPVREHVPLFDPCSVCLLPDYSRKVGFYSDNNHFAVTELYTKYLLPRASQAKFLEDIHTRPALQTASLWGRYYGSHQYATHQILDHLDGRDLKWCKEEESESWEGSPPTLERQPAGA